MDDPLEKAATRIASLRNELSTKIKFLKETEVRCNTLKKTIEERDNTIKQLEEYNVKREDEFTIIENTHWNEIETVQNELKKQAEDIELKQSELQEEKLILEDERIKIQQRIQQIINEKDEIGRERERVLHQNLIDGATYQNALATLHASHNASLTQLTERIQQLQGDVDSSLSQVQLHSSKIKTLESQLIYEQDANTRLRKDYEDERKRIEEEREAERKQYEERRNALHQQINSLHAKKEEDTRALEKQTRLTEERVRILCEWENQRENIEKINSNLTIQCSQMQKEISSFEKKLKDHERISTEEITSLRKEVARLEEDKNKLTTSLKQKKAALKIYHDEMEAKAQAARMIKDEEGNKKKGSGLSAFANGFSSLFGKEKDKDINGTSSTLSSGHLRSGGRSQLSNEAFLDVEEEMSIALSERVEKLTQEKSRLQEDIIVLQRQLEQEQYMNAQLRAQVPQSKNNDAGDRAQLKKDRAILSPENTQRLLSLTIAANNELESQRKLDSAELKRLRALLEVKKQEVQDLKAALERRDSQSHLLSTNTPSAKAITSLLTTPQRQSRRPPISATPDAVSIAKQ